MHECISIRPCPFRDNRLCPPIPLGTVVYVLPIKSHIPADDFNREIHAQPFPCISVIIVGTYTTVPCGTACICPLPGGLFYFATTFFSFCQRTTLPVFFFKLLLYTLFQIRIQDSGIRWVFSLSTISYILIPKRRREER